MVDDLSAVKNSLDGKRRKNKLHRKNAHSDRRKIKGNVALEKILKALYKRLKK